MASLGDKLIQLSLEIEDRTKTAELLSQLINDQNNRQANECDSFEIEQHGILERFTNESKEKTAGLLVANQSLTETKKVLEIQLDNLMSTHRHAEITKKKNIDDMKQEIANAKQAAHQAFVIEKEKREKAWYDGRVAEINRITWQGIEPSIQRLVAKHKEQCDEIKSNHELSKKKLELLCENELAERVQVLRRNEHQPPNAFVNQQTDFASMLGNEQKEHDLSLRTLKEQFVEEEESSTNAHAAQLDTLAKEHEATLLCNNSLSNRKKLELERDLNSKRTLFEHELQSNADRIQQEFTMAKTEWEEDWLRASDAKVEKIKSNKMEDLHVWRKSEIDGLIRKSLIQKMSQNLSPEDTGNIDTAPFSAHVSALSKNISDQQATNSVIKGRLAIIADNKAAIGVRISAVEDTLSLVNAKLKDLTVEVEQKQMHHQRSVNEAAIQIEHETKEATV
jgi:hypothetical protein